jgi:hypothetical protein
MIPAGLKYRGLWLIMFLILVTCPNVTLRSETAKSAAGDQVIEAVTYYVDPEGNDANSGMSPGKAWKTLQRVNQHEFRPSDRMLFKRGGEWHGQLRISGRGTVERPIVLSAYGEGAQPGIYNTYVLSPSMKVKRDPRWSKQPDHKNVYMIHSDLKVTELIYEGRRLSRVDAITRLENQTYFVRDGWWYLKDMKGNPEETGVSIQVVAPEQNAVLLTGSKYVILDGLDIRGGSGVNGYVGALSINDSDHVEVRNCTVSNSTNAAVMISRSQHISISNCDVSNAGLGGVYTGNCTDSVISGNDIHDNGSCLHDLNDLHGIGLGSRSERIVIEYNHIHHNGYGGGSPDRGDSAVTLYSASECIVRYNLIDQNWHGAISVDSGHEGNSDHTIVQNNIIMDNGLSGSGGRYPALAVQAHQPSTSDHILFANNTIIRQRTGDLWSLASKKPQAASAGDKFKGINCQGTVAFWEGAYLIAVISGTLNGDDVIESVDGRWKATVLSINSAPAAIVLMSPSEPVRDVVLKRNIVADTQGSYDLSTGRNVTVNLADNCFWRKGGSVRNRENDMGRYFFGKGGQGSLLEDPKFKDVRIPEGLIPEDNDCKECGAQPQVWLDKVKL